MPLSEHEQKLLEQMERALYAEDPKFASSMKGQRRAGPPKKRVVVGLCLALLGLACVVAGVSLELIWLGGVGFAVMVAGVAWAATPSRSHRGEPSDAVNPAAVPGTHGPARGAAGLRSVKPTGKNRGVQPKSKGTGSFMQRMEQRWEKRRDEGQNF